MYCVRMCRNWGRDLKVSFKEVRAALPPIQYAEMDPKPPTVDIGGLLFSAHKGLPGTYLFRRQLDRNKAKVSLSLSLSLLFSSWSDCFLDL